MSISVPPPWFRLKEMSGTEFKTSMGETKNFQPGWVQLVDGSRRTGPVAAAKDGRTGPFPTAMLPLLVEGSLVLARLRTYPRTSS